MRWTSKSSGTAVSIVSMNFRNSIARCRRCRWADHTAALGIEGREERRGAVAPVKPEWRTPQPEELFRLLDEYEMRTTGTDARKRYGGRERGTGDRGLETGDRPVETQSELF